MEHTPPPWAEPLIDYNAIVRVWLEHRDRFAAAQRAFAESHGRPVDPPPSSPLTDRKRMLPSVVAWAERHGLAKTEGPPSARDDYGVSLYRALTSFATGLRRELLDRLGEQRFERGLQFIIFMVISEIWREWDITIERREPQGRPRKTLDRADDLLHEYRRVMRRLSDRAKFELPTRAAFEGHPKENAEFVADQLRSHGVRGIPLSEIHRAYKCERPRAHLAYCLTGRRFGLRPDEVRRGLELLRRRQREAIQKVLDDINDDPELTSYDAIEPISVRRVSDYAPRRR